MALGLLVTLFPFAGARVGSEKGFAEPRPPAGRAGTGRALRGPGAHGKPTARARLGHRRGMGGTGTAGGAEPSVWRPAGQCLGEARALTACPAAGPLRCLWSCLPPSCAPLQRLTLWHHSRAPSQGLGDDPSPCLSPPPLLPRPGHCRPHTPDTRPPCPWQSGLGQASGQRLSSEPGNGSCSQP